MKPLKQLFIYIIVVSILLTTGLPFHTEAAKKKVEKPLFLSDAPLELTLEYDIRSFRKDKGEDRDYHSATLSYKESDTKTISMPVKIMARGKLRRTFLPCIVPSFKMKFDKNTSKDTIFQGQKSLKLVTHCKNKPKFYEEYYIQEYLIYKVYNLLSPLSYRVRLANITYIDTKKQEESFTRIAFFIERYKYMAKRCNAKTTKVKEIKLTQADQVTAALVSVFQYMIGNTDYSIRGGHNIDWIVKKEKTGKYFPIPFDFDLSGMIDSHYARPDEQFPIRSVRERYFRGHTKNVGLLNIVFVKFHKHKDAIYDIYRNTPLLSDKLKDRTIDYLDSFYQIISNPKLVKRYFIENYRGRPRPKR